MKSILVLAALFVVVNAAGAQAVIVERHNPFATGTRYDGLYDMDTQLTFKGVVTGIQRVRPSANSELEVSLIVKNEEGGGTITVELGPSWYVDRQAVQIEIKDEAQITGSKVMIGGRGVILAKLVQVGTEVLALRRPSGIPYWFTKPPVTPLGNDNHEPSTFEGYRAYGQDGTMYSGLIYRAPFNNLIVDLGPQWYDQPSSYVIPFGPNIHIATNGNHWLGYPGYYGRFRF
jgi:hypothetical protein